ncbi:SRPBCC family protein [Streptomyces sp. NPDC051561]|uniref:SRPBCC family protein n=1 Tax=Streptomyces sp. NPDC051561 TaxID=3365658 RepID=UPI00379184BB
MTARKHRLVRTAVVAAGPAEVWELIGGFAGLGDWHPHLPPSTAEGEGDPALPGAVRVFAIDGKVVARERLLARDEDTRAYTYTVLDPMLPIGDYIATLAVHPHENGRADGTEIVWSAEYSGADEVVPQVEALFGDGTYGTGLAALREKFGRAQV